MIDSLIQHQPSINIDVFDGFKKKLPPSMRKDLKNRKKGKEILDKIVESNAEKKLSEILDQEDVFRASYVPMIVTNVAWDYADTIILMAIQMKMPGVKELSRSIRELKREYDRVSAPFLCDCSKETAEENLYEFEDGVRDLFNLYQLNIEWDIRSEYPRLIDEHVIFLKAVYQCHIVLMAIFRYGDLQKKKIESKFGKEIRHPIPTHLFTLDKLVLKYAGEKQLSDWFSNQQSTYANSIANRMALIELNVIED